MTIASQFNKKSPIRALALTAKIQPTIGGVKSSVPPSTTSATINSTPSKTAKAAANAAKERPVHMALFNAQAVHRAAKVATIAAAPMAKPQANEVIVHGYRRTMKPTNWLASQTAPVKSIASRRFKVRAAAVLNAAKGVAQAKPRLNATLAQTSKANQRW